MVSNLHRQDSGISGKGHGDFDRALRGSLANYSAAILQMGGFAFHVLGARLFGKSAYGAYIFAWGVVEIAGKLGIFGLDKGVMRAVATERARKDPEAESRVLATALGGVTLSSALVIMGLLLFAGPLAQWKGDALFTSVLRVLAFLIPPWAGVMVLIYATMATGTMRYNLLVRGVAEPLLMLFALGVVAFIWPEGGGAALALGHVCATGALLALAFLAFSRLFQLDQLKRRVIWSRPDWGLLWFSFPVALSELFNHSIYRIDVIMIGLLLKDPLQVANYGACIMLSGAISSIRYAFDPIVSPVAAEVTVSEDRARLDRNLKMMVRWVTVLGLPLFLAMALFGDFLLSFWGETYREAHFTLLILACGHLVNAVLGLHQWPVVMSGRSKLDLFNNMLAFTVNLILNLKLIPVWGLPGAALATLAGNIVFRVLQALQVWRIFHIHAFSPEWFKVLTSAAAAAVVGGTFRWVLLPPDLSGFLGAAAAAVASYVLVGIALGLAPEDQEVIRRIGLGRRNK